MEDGENKERKKDISLDFQRPWCMWKELRKNDISWHFV